MLCRMEKEKCFWGNSRPQEPYRDCGIFSLFKGEVSTCDWESLLQRKDWVSPLGLNRNRVHAILTSIQMESAMNLMLARIPEPAISWIHTICHVCIWMPVESVAAQGFHWETAIVMAMLSMSLEYVGEHALPMKTVMGFAMT